MACWEEGWGSRVTLWYSNFLASEQVQQLSGVMQSVLVSARQAFNEGGLLAIIDTEGAHNPPPPPPPS